MDIKNNTFIVKVMREQNDTWQGSITWAEENRTEYFRSALEMISLMNDAIKQGEQSRKDNI